MRKLAHLQSGKMLTDYRPIGTETEIHQQAAGGVPVTIRRVDGLWHIEGDVKLPKKNEFAHLADARNYLRLLRKEASPQQRSERLRQLIAAHNLTTRQVAAICAVSERTVDNWRVTGTGHRNPPAMALKLLEQYLAENAKAAPQA
jgi:DNA-binding transcriptional regulator YiaG